MKENSLPIPEALKRPKKKGVKILTFALLGILTAGLALGGYKVIQSRRAPPTPTPTPTPIPSSIPTATPIPQKPLEKIKIIEGNVCLVTDSFEPEILVNKDDFLSESIIRFAEIRTSPDKTKMCFLGYTAASIWLYYANLDGSEATKIGLAKNCVWSLNSQKIAYNNHTTDVSPVDVYVYDLATGESKNLTQATAREKHTRFYELPRWREDDQKITAKFVEVKKLDERTRVTGFSEIDLQTSEIVDQILTEEIVDY